MLPLRLLAFRRARIFDHGPHAREILVTDIALREDHADDFAGVAAKEIANDAGDRLASHVQLAHRGAIDEGPSVAAMSDDSLLLQASQHGADGRNSQWAGTLQRGLDLNRRRLGLVPQDSDNRQLEITEVEARRHAGNYNCR